MINHKNSFKNVQYHKMGQLMRYYHYRWCALFSGCNAKLCTETSEM